MLESRLSGHSFKLVGGTQRDSRTPGIKVTFDFVDKPGSIVNAAESRRY
jgi:hypothetical protein